MTPDEVTHAMLLPSPIESWSSVANRSPDNKPLDQSPRCAHYRACYAIFGRRSRSVIDAVAQGGHRRQVVRAHTRWTRCLRREPNKVHALAVPEKRLVILDAVRGAVAQEFGQPATRHFFFFLSSSPAAQGLAEGPLRFILVFLPFPAAQIRFLEATVAGLSRCLVFFLSFLFFLSAWS